MPITLGTNLASLQSQRQLFQRSNALGSVLERLASGKRINRAVDDSAGLAVSSALQTNSRVYSQGVRNVNDGISVLSIADSALSTLKVIAERQRELATQSASGSYSSQQREALDQEFQSLSSEYQRVLHTAVYNGRQIFGEEFDKLEIAAGGQPLDISLRGPEERSVELGLGSYSEVVTDQSVVGDALENLPTGVLAGQDGVIFVAGFITVGGILQAAVQSFQFNEADGSLKPINFARSFGTIGFVPNQFTSGSLFLDGDTLLFEGHLTIGFKTEGGFQLDLSSGGITPIGSTGKAGERLYAEHELDLNGDGFLDRISTRVENDELLVTVGLQDVGVARSTAEKLAQHTGDILSVSSASWQVDSLESLSERINSSSSAVGANLSRLQSATNLLSALSEQYQSADARIVDADIAQEVANLTRESVLSDVTAALLAQANLQPALALDLLGIKT